MSQLLVAHYHREIDALSRYGGSRDEGSIRKAFSNLLDVYCRPRDLRLIDELEFITKQNAKVYPDGTVKDALRLTHGYWEAKDEYDNLDEEIAKKRAKGYPTDNILFEDSRIAVLIQNDQEAMRVDMVDPEALDRLITLFLAYERPEIRDFRRAVEKFKEDLPAVLESLRGMIEDQQKANKAFAVALAAFLKLCKDSINADISPQDVREMLIQHILTEDIFLQVFNDAQFHQENNIARELNRVEQTFFTGTTKRNTLKRLESYYGAIRQTAAGIYDHHEKQGFLKAIYENFYKVYNPKLADRLGVVYTPNEIVRFMIQGAETLLHRHFDRLLQDYHVEILDPAVGTGTFISDLIEHLKGNPAALKYKYQNEIHCNEVAILPYYIANLNIEFTYAQIAGEYLEFPHICFVDTLDNLGFERTYRGQNMAFDFGLSAENTERIHKQNKRRISVILGNPPYNANQMNENDNNKNRVYAGIDKRIKDTWIAASGAQKTKMYDMYARFFRWAADRIDADGVIAFVTNRSFIDSRTFDGFRKEMAKEFNEAHIVDLGGDVRANPKLSGTTHNVFGIQTGVAISFWVKKKGAKGCKVWYARRPELETAGDKLAYLSGTPFDQVAFTHVVPDAKGNWINLADNDFDELLPLCSKGTKAGNSPTKDKALFRMFSLGVVTARDEWVFDDNDDAIETKVRFLIDTYNADLKRYGGKPTADVVDHLNPSIKWTRALKNDLRNNACYEFSPHDIRSCLYRPFVFRRLYFNKNLNEVRYQLPYLFPMESAENVCITFLSIISSWPLATLATNKPFDYCLLKQGNGATQSIPLYLYDDQGNRVNNLTDWGVKQFEKRYGKRAKITRRDIFHYVYAVLHDPAYREKYALNLKRELPRIPLYDDFRQWAEWGERLMELHLGFETVDPWPLERLETLTPGPSPASGRGEPVPKAKLKADKSAGRIVLDEATTLAGIPPQAWDYRLGNRSALEWILDQHKETAPRDPTIRERFNTYRFADHKEQVIDLLKRVCTLSVETQAIVSAMAGSQTRCLSEGTQDRPGSDAAA